MKKTALIAMVLCLVALAAQAAPTREPTPAVLDNGDLVAQVQPLADLAAALAFTFDTPVLSRDGAPDQGLAQAALYLALSRHLLVVEAREGLVTLSNQDADKEAGSLFAKPDIRVTGEARIPGLTILDEGMRFDISRLDDYVGTHVVDLSISEESLNIKADAYRLSGIRDSAVAAPEDSLQWLGYIEIELMPKVDSLLGFGLSAYTVTEHYEPASLEQFVLKDRFELQYPSLFGKAEAKEGELLSLVNADGAARLSVSEVPLSLEALAGGWDSARTLVEADRVTYTAPGLFRVAYADRVGEGEGCLVLELVYPESRMMEFTLYQTFLNNSFVVYSHSMG